MNRRIFGALAAVALVPVIGHGASATGSHPAGSSRLADPLGRLDASSQTETAVATFLVGSPFTVLAQASEQPPVIVETDSSATTEGAATESEATVEVKTEQPPEDKPAVEAAETPAAEPAAQSESAETPAVEPAAQNGTAQVPPPPAEAEASSEAQSTSETPPSETPAGEATATEQQAPAEEAQATETPPAAAETAPVTEEPAPTAETAPPASEAPAATSESAPPPAETPAAAAETESPPAETAAPTAESQAPAADTAAPAAESQSPPTETAAPAAESQAPAAETAAPTAESQSPPAETAAPAAESQTPPAQTSTTAETQPAEPQPAASTTIEQQVQQAEQTPTAVVPDQISAEDRARLEAAEAQRRKDARKRRRELIGAAAAGAAVGALVPLLGGKIIEDEGDRFVVERNGEYFVRKDESALLRDYGSTIEIEDLARGRTRETITRPNGVKVVTLRDAGGYVLRRVKVFPDGEEVVLFDSRDEVEYIDYDRRLPPLRYDIAEDEYIVLGSRRDRAALRRTFLAPPVEAVETRYSLREVRENQRLREKVRRVDLDTITFDTGSATVHRSEVPLLGNIAGGMLDVIEQDPKAVFLIEGHTDAVGDEVSNLTLSDRRAETVARILVESYGLPPENLVVEGYGEAYLKVPTEGPERRNRRVTIRNISPLLMSQAQ